MFQDIMRNRQGRRDKAVNQVVRRVLEQVVYRQELGMKYTTFDFARKTNAAADEKWRGAERNTHMKPRVIPTTVEELLLFNASDNLQAVGRAVGFITMRHQLAGRIGLNTTVLSEDLPMPDATLQDNEREADASENDDKDESHAVDSEEEGQPPKRQRMDANDAIVPVAEEEESIEQLTCFGMLKSRPGGIKSLATYVEKGGTKVSPTSFAVTLHSCEECPETGALIVDGQPRAMGSSGMRAVVVDSLNPGLSLPALYASMHGHINQGQPSLRMSLLVTMRGSRMDLHVALDKMLQARAVGGRHGVVEGDVSSWPWATLVESGFVKINSIDVSDVSRRNHVYKQISTSQEMHACVLSLPLSLYIYIYIYKYIQVSIDPIGIEEHDHGHHLRKQMSYIYCARSSASGRPLYAGAGQVFARQRLVMATDAKRHQESRGAAATCY